MARRRGCPASAASLLNVETTGFSAYKEKIVELAAVSRANSIYTDQEMPLTVFDVKGISAARRERIEAAVVSGGKHVPRPHEAWIAADLRCGDVRVLITRPQGFERAVVFAIDEAHAVIRERIRETLQ